MADQPEDLTWVPLEVLRADLAKPDRARPEHEHAKRVEPAAGDWYVVCACGWVSLPYVADKHAHEALAYRCPVEAADRERATNRAKLRERLGE